MIVVLGSELLFWILRQLTYIIVSRLMRKIGELAASFRSLCMSFRAYRPGPLVRCSERTWRLAGKSQGCTLFFAWGRNKTVWIVKLYVILLLP